MGIPTPLSIKYRDQTIGGASIYQIHGPYQLSRSHQDFSLSCTVVVTATSLSDLKSQSEDLEDNWSKRMDPDDELTISLGGSTFVWTQGKTLLNGMASISKTGNMETDRGVSRSYVVTVTGQIPAEEENGLREIQCNVAASDTGIRTVRMSGLYTATESATALENYENQVEDEADTYLTAVDSEASFELIEATFDLDRHRDGSGDPAPNLCSWSRTYMEVISDQSSGGLEDPQIVSHRVSFTDETQYPGDSDEFVRKLHRVRASFSCGVVVSETKDLATVWSEKGLQLLTSKFLQEFNPQSWAWEALTLGYDISNNRINANATFIYHPAGGDAVVEVRQSVTLRESRNLDMTPVHDESELSYEIDIGWATVERIWTRTVIVVGSEVPKLRITESPRTADAGLIPDIAGQKSVDRENHTQVKREGWNVISSSSQVEPRWIGNPQPEGGEGEQIQCMVLTENVVERYTKRPGQSTSTPIQQAPQTGG